MVNKSSDGQFGKDQVGSYAPGWLKKSRDDVPQTDKPPRENSVLNRILADAAPDNEQGGRSQQSVQERGSSESER